MWIRKAIPNLFTSLNLLCGCMGIVLSFQHEMIWSSILIGIAAIFDFLDGMLARLLRGQSEIGKQLDSLADMVTFGVLPGMIMFQFISAGYGEYNVPILDRPYSHLLTAMVAMLIPIFSALRLAKFNIDENQQDAFIGMPTPACALFVASFPIIMQTQLLLNMYYPLDQSTILDYQGIFRWDGFEVWLVSLLYNPNFYMITSIILSLMLVAPVKLFSFKFKNLGWSDNKIRYIFLILCGLGLIAVFRPYWDIGLLDYNLKIDFVLMPLVIILYVLLSLLNNLLNSIFNHEICS